MSEQQMEVGAVVEEQVVDLNGIFMEFHEYRAEHPGSMSANALKV